MIKKILKRVGLLLLVALIIAQFFGPEENNGDLASVTPFLVDTNASEPVKTILETACMDCHSEHTRYPWYNSITPVNYWMAHHVDEAKSHFNMSLWNSYSDKKKDHKLEELIEEVEEEHMPITSYKLTHGDAKLTSEQIETLINWAKQARQKYLFSERAQ